MSGALDPWLRNLDDCGCGEGRRILTPREIFNRPGLTEIAHRVGSHASFKQTMLARIADSRHPVLQGLRAREDDDFAIALIDAWAVVADVLTFYQERVANESYLRTATERRSLVELARLIGYQLHPGVAASVHLAFAAEEGENAAKQMLLPTGTAARSVPREQDERSQTFETSRDLLVKPEWNLWRPRRTRPQEITVGSDQVFLEGTGLDAQVGDAVLFVPAAADGAQAASIPPTWDLRRVIGVELQNEEHRTRLALTASDGVRAFPKNPEVHLLSQRANVFGHNAADWAALPDPAKASYLGIADPTELLDDEKKEWPRFLVNAPLYPPAFPDEIEPPTRPPSADSVAEAIIARAEMAVNTAAHAAGASVADAFGSVAEAIQSVFSAPGDVAGSGAETNIISALQAVLPTPGSEDFPEASDFDLTFSLENLVTLDLSEVVQSIFDSTSDLLPSDEAIANLGGAIAGLVSGPLFDALNQILGAAQNAAEAVNDVPQGVARALGAYAVGLSVKLAVQTAVSTPIRLPGIDAPVKVLTPEEIEALAKVTACVAVFALKVQPGATTPDDLIVPVNDVTTPEDFLTEMKNNLQVGDNDCFHGILEDAAAMQFGVGLAAALLAIHGPLVLAPVLLLGVTLGDKLVDGGCEAKDAIFETIEGALESEVLSPRRPFAHLSAHDVDLDAAYKKITGGIVLFALPDKEQHLARIRDVTEVSRADFQLSRQVTRVTLEGLTLPVPPQDEDEEDAAPAEAGWWQKVRDVTVFAGSRKLPLAADPVTEAVSGSSIELDRVVEVAEAGRTLIVTGTVDQSREAHRQVVTLDHVEPVVVDATTDQNLSRLHLRDELGQALQRDTVAIHANVVHATHGESQQQVLGDGDAGVPFQHFGLEGHPVTYTSAATETGVASSVRVHAGGLRWAEAASLFERGPRERAYQVRADDDGVSTLTFGDGNNAVRLPSGRDNVVARYRVGIGQEGNVGRDQITLLPKRGLGLSEVTNPLSSAGGADRETADSMRRNAAVGLRTLGRIVSLRDYEDFAAAFGGVQKALATWTWDGSARAVALTILDAGGDTSSRLREAILAASDPHVPFRVTSASPDDFRLEARVLCDPARVASEVLEEAARRLRRHFGVDARDFGQPVTRGEVVAVIQRTPGVLAVDLDALYRVKAADGTPIGQKGNPERLSAALPRAGAAHFQPAELLVLHDAGPSLMVMT